MDILALILTPLLTGLTAAIATYIIGKHVISTQIEEWLDYFKTQDGVQDLATIGAAIASGAMTQLKFGKGASGIKIAGIKIPQALVDIGISKIAQMLGMVPQEQPQA